MYQPSYLFESGKRDLPTEEYVITKDRGAI